MQKLAEVCIKRPVFATMLVMAFVVVGAASWMRLGVDRFPAVDLPTVNVRVELPGASTEEMETQVAQKLEEQINTIQGINELRSISGAGTTIVIVTFALNRQIDVAAQDVRDKVAIAVRNLPREILPPVVSKFDNDQAPVVTIALSSERSLRELTEIADKTVRPVLERSSVSARCGSSAGCRAPSTSGSTRTGWPPTRFRSRPSAMRSCARTPTCRAAT
jgi:HAE1 family hydrophobic/amphiphilic exporter-1